MEYILTKDTLHIKDSYLVESEDDMVLFLNKVMSESSTDTIVWKLSMSEMVNKWKGHNLLYYFGLFQSRTKDVDINKNCWILRFGYKILAKIYDCFVY